MRYLHPISEGSPTPVFLDEPLLPLSNDYAEGGLFYLDENHPSDVRWKGSAQRLRRALGGRTAARRRARMHQRSRLKKG